jgi:Flp pilus assembly protein TadG
MGALRRQAGQATIEYLYVVPILLLLLLASLQFVFIYEAKHTLNYATFAATRAGALNNGSLEAIQDGLAAGLTPLFAHDTTQQALKDARATAKSETGDSKLALIEILNPTAAALAGFQNSLGEIPNDNLMYRKHKDSENLKGGMNVQDANLLKVRVTYCVRLVVPLVNRMISSFTVAPPLQGAKIDSYAGGSIAAPELLKVEAPGASSGLCSDPTNAYPYRIPVTSEAVVRMQSPFRNSDDKWTAP